MSALVDQALLRAGLAGFEELRRVELAKSADWAETLRDADLLVLGALADRVRRDEVGDEVRVYLTPAPSAGVTVLASPGFGLLREVALARLLGPRAARIRVDFSATGLELAQVALGFGASELSGVPATKRGLPIAEGELTDRGKKSARVTLAASKRAEVEFLVRRAGRKPVVVDGAVVARTEEVVP